MIHENNKTQYLNKEFENLFNLLSKEPEDINILKLIMKDFFVNREQEIYNNSMKETNFFEEASNIINEWKNQENINTIQDILNEQLVKIEEEKNYKKEITEGCNLLKQYGCTEDNIKKFDDICTELTKHKDEINDINNNQILTEEEKTSQLLNIL